ncbi:hypothetical protein ABTA95_20035, partial [Acinetobacter baumannii]
SLMAAGRRSRDRAVPPAVDPHRISAMIIAANRPYSPKCEEKTAASNSIKRGITGKNGGDFQLNKKKETSYACGDFASSLHHPETCRKSPFEGGYL